MSTLTRNRSGAKTRGRTVKSDFVSANGASYVVSTGLHGEAKTLIRNPHDHDVLSGRGGGINSHPGNITFRDWVRERKNEYNLAANKTEKARVSREIVDRVKSLDPPGRFLAKDPDAKGGYGNGLVGWVEVSDEKAMQKTSQALREGAPKIRADHAMDEKRSRTAEVRLATPVLNQPIGVRPIQPLSRASAAAVNALKRNAEAAKREAEEEERQEAMHPPKKRAKAKHDSRSDDVSDPRTTAPTPPPNDETPPLKPVPPIKFGWPPSSAFAMPPSVKNKKEENLVRTNSLALDDTDKDASFLGAPFVNPFEDEFEDEALGRNGKAKLSKSLTDSSSSHGDLGGIGALMNDSKNEVPFVNVLF